MESRTIVGFLVSVILFHMITGCATVITREYGARHSSIRAVMQNMMQDRAIAIVYCYCHATVQRDQDMETRGRTEFIKRAGDNVSVDSLGLSYTLYTVGPVVRSESLQRADGYRFTTYHKVIPVTRRVNFADVKTIKYMNFDEVIYLLLLDGNGHKLFCFGGNLTHYSWIVFSHPCGKDEIERLIAALLILCPNVP